jgi:hypothetical protein
LTNDKIIFVTGGTANQGGAVAEVYCSMAFQIIKFKKLNRELVRLTPGFIKSESSPKGECFTPIDDAAPDDCPPELEQYIDEDFNELCEDGVVINTFTWSLDELKVPCYPEKRVFSKVTNILKKRYPAFNISMRLD